jgi:hypothetical protein
LEKQPKPGMVTAVPDRDTPLQPRASAWRRAFRLLLRLSILLLLGAAVAIYLAVTQPERVLREVLKHFLPELEWKTGAISLDLRGGTLRAERVDASIKDRFAFVAEEFRIESLLWGSGAPALRRFEVKNGTLNLDIPLKQQAGETASAGTQAPPLPDLKIENLKVEARFPDGFHASGNVNLSWNALSNPDAPAVLTAENVRMVHGGTRLAEIGEARVDFLASKGVADSVHVRNARIDVSAELMHFLQQFHRDSENAQPAPVASAPEMFPVRRVHIDNAEILVDVPDLPYARARIDVEPAGAGSMHRIMLREIESRSGPEGLQWDLALGKVGAELDLARIGEGVLDGIEIRDGRVTLVPGGPVEPGTLPPGSADSGSVLPHIRMNSVLVENVSVLLSGSGAITPSAQGTLNLAVKDLDLSAASMDEEIRTAQIRNLSAWFAGREPFLIVPEITVEASPASLMRQRKVEKISIPELSFDVDAETRALLAAGGETEGAPPAVADSGSSGAAWSVGLIELPSARIALDELGFGLPTLRFTLTTALTDVPLSAAPSLAAEQTQKVELSDFRIVSPLDPFAPVLTFRSIFVEFSLAGLLRKELASITLLEPTIYAGKDLFWYVDEIKRQTAEEEGAEPAQEDAGAPEGQWVIHQFKAAFGKLVISTDGAPRVALPIEFETQAENVRFDRLADLRLNLDVNVPVDDYHFPAYKLELLSLGGRLDFGLPPDGNASNLVNTLEVQEVRWRQFLSKEAWLSVTYDRKGIYGQFGGNAYSGYINGGFSFFLDSDFPWTGWVSASGFDLGAFTDILAPESVRISGVADGQVEVNATGPRIDRVIGSLKPRDGGKLEITKIDALLAELPPEWGSIKRSMTQVGLGALRDFRYDAGGATFWFLERAGQISLNLRGPEGSRVFDVRVHDANLMIPEKPPNLRLQMRP